MEVIKTEQGISFCPKITSFSVIKSEKNENNCSIECDGLVREFCVVGAGS